MRARGSLDAENNHARRQGAASGRISAATAILDRGYGKARQEVAISGELDLGRLSDDQLDELERLMVLAGCRGRPSERALTSPSALRHRLSGAARGRGKLRTSPVVMATG